MNTYFNDSDFELGKVIVALNKNFNKVNLFTCDINHIFNGIDIEKIEVISTIYKLLNNQKMV